MLNGDGGQITEFVPPARIFEPFNFTPMAVNPISFGSPHVRPMGRTCGEPDEIKKNTHPKYFTALFREQARIFEQLSSFVNQARSTSIFVLNLSDLKPAVLSAAAALSFVWDPEPYLVNSSTPGVPNRTAAQSQAAFLQVVTESEQCAGNLARVAFLVPFASPHARPTRALGNMLRAATQSKSTCCGDHSPKN